jgi:hypothetical protein
VIIHELGHQVGCWVTGTRVLEVSYLRLGVPAGYVIHAQPASPWRHMIIAAGPFLVNSALAFGIGWAHLQGWWASDPAWLSPLVLVWLGVAIGMHAFPSMQDATSLLDSVWTRGAGFFAKLLITPIGALMVLGAFANWVFLDLAWGLAFAWIAPRLIAGQPLWGPLLA